MRILQLIFTAGLGGSERHVVELCNGLAHEGHQVIVTLRRGAKEINDKLCDWLDPRVKVSYIPKRFPGFHLWWLIRTFKPDIVHAHNNRASRYLGRMPIKQQKIATLHINYSQDHKRIKNLICIANWQRHEIPAHHHTTTISNWVVPVITPQDTLDLVRKTLGLTDNHRVFGIVARLVEIKGVDIAIEAFNRLNAAHAKLVIIGDGRCRSHLEKIANHNVIFVGQTHQAKHYYPLFDCFILPSRAEPFGLVLLEAMACHLPIISTITQGPREYFQDYPIEWVDVDDVHTMEKAMRKVIDQALLTKIDYNLQPFDYTSRIREIEEFYSQVLNRFNKI